MGFVASPIGSLKYGLSCADPEGGGGVGGPDPPEKSQKYRVF